MLNHRMLSAILEEMAIHTSISFSKDYTASPKAALDLRNAITPKNRRPGMPVFSEWEAYHQVFSDRHEFEANLSIIDLLFNLGPDSTAYLIDAAEKTRFQLNDG